ITNNVVDGNSTDDTNHTLVGILRGGTVTLEYNIIKNATGHALFLGGSGDPTSGLENNITFKFNDIEQSGQTSNPSIHADLVITAQKTLYTGISGNFNLFRQLSFPSGGGSQGVTDDGGSNGN